MGEGEVVTCSTMAAASAMCSRSTRRTTIYDASRTALAAAAAAGQALRSCRALTSMLPMPREDGLYQS